MKTRLLLGTFAIVASVGLTSCGKKDSDSSPAPQNDQKPTSGDSKSVEDGVDGRLFGSWLLLEQPLKDKVTGEEIPDFKLRLSMTIAKDKLTSTSEMVKAGKVTCKAEASTNQFAISKDKIVINEGLSKETKIDEKNNCQTELKKSSMGYSLESSDVLSLKSEDGGESIKVNRVK